MDLNFREKLGITIISNLIFFIIIGYIGSWFNLPITFEYFLFSLTLAYFSILLIVLYQRYHRQTEFFLKKPKYYNSNQKMDTNLSFLNYVKKFISLNGILLGFFIFLLCVLFIVITEFFAATDPWLHISLIKYIAEVNYIPLNEYYGAVGFHIFGTVLHFFSGLEIIQIPKYFVLYAIPLCSLIVYNFLIRIFKNKNLAIFGVFLLNISSLGFIHLLTQFWPSSLALTQCLILFFLLYVRLESFTKVRIPKKEDILSNMLFSYIFSVIIFIISYLTHSLLTMILIFSYLWVYLIYFIRNYRRGFDFILLFSFLCLFIIFYYFNISAGQFRIFDPLGFLSWYHIFLGVLIFMFFEILILRHFRKSLDFTKGKFNLILLGKKHRIYKKIEDKYLFPFVCLLILFLISFYTIFNLLVFNFDILSIFNAVEILVLWLFGFWGLTVFQYKSKGKPLFLWFLSLGLIFLIVFIFDAAVGVTSFFSRVFYLSSIVISIGFTSYIYKLIKTNSIQQRKFKFFIIFILFFSLIVSSLQNSVSIEMFSLKEREVSSVEWYSYYTTNSQVIISEFGWGPIFIYYDYPYENKNKTLSLGSIHVLLPVNEELLHPSMHYNSTGINLLKNLKKFYGIEDFGIEVVLILPKEFYLLSSWKFFDELSEEEIETYYNLEYLNRIFSSKGENGEEIPYYWVI